MDEIRVSAEELRYQRDRGREYGYRMMRNGTIYAPKPSPYQESIRQMLHKMIASYSIDERFVGRCIPTKEFLDEIADTYAEIYAVNAYLAAEMQRGSIWTQERLDNFNCAKQQVDELTAELTDSIEDLRVRGLLMPGWYPTCAESAALDRDIQAIRNIFKDGRNRRVRH